MGGSIFGSDYVVGSGYDGVNVEEWLTYFLNHVHEYDSDYSRDLADLLPYALEANGILKKSETLAASSENL